MATHGRPRPAHVPVVRQDEVRRHNSSRVLRLIHIRGPVSRSDLTAETGLNRSTVGALTSALADAGLVREVVPVGRGVGRPSIVVEPAVDLVHVVAVNIAVDRTVGALVGLGGEVLRRGERRRDRKPVTPRHVVTELRGLIGELERGLPGGSLCVGICVSVPGLVRQSDGMVRLAPNLGWADVPLAQLLVDELPGTAPVHIANEADLGGLAEHLRGDAVDTANLLYLFGDVGVGGSTILDGRLLVGAGGYTGEVGHMVVNPEGRRCRCGSRGCWETEIGEDAVAAALGVPGQVLDADDVLRLGAEATGDPLAGVGHWLGVGVANLVNVLNPELVLFGGLLRGVFPLTEAHVRAALASSLVASHDDVRLETAGLGDDSNLLGAAERAFAPLLDDPFGVIERTRRDLVATD